MPLFFTMANLSAYIDFSVALNFKTNSILINSVAIDPLPIGIAALEVSATIKQPDNITGQLPSIQVAGIYPLNFSGSRGLRLTVNDQPQVGKYIVTVTVKAAGYDDTVIKKEFTLDYDRAKVVISKNFDLITPLLLLKDESIYNRTGMTITNLVREWLVNIGGVGSITPGNVQEADLAYLGDYYDASYQAILVSKIHYSVAGYDFLTVYDEVAGEFQTTANTIPPFSTFPDILQEIADLSTGVESGECNCHTCDTPEYKAAYILFKAIELAICGPITNGLLGNIEEFLKIYYRLKGAYVNTDQVIDPYDRSFCTGGDPGGNNFIQNRTTPQQNANINIDGGITMGNIPHSTEAIVQMYLIAEGGRIKYLNEAEMLERFGGGVGAAVWGGIGGLLASQTDLVTALGAKLNANPAIAPATKTKITYDANGLVTAGADLTEDDIPSLPQAKITGLLAVLDSKSNTGHTHSISEVSGLASILLGKLDTGLAVLLNGDQAINGAKTFAQSPIVPAPANSTHAANKQYVDDVLSGAITTPYLKKAADDNNGVNKLTLGKLEAGDTKLTAKVEMTALPAGTNADAVVVITAAGEVKKLSSGIAKFFNSSFNATTDWTLEGVLGDEASTYKIVFTHNLNTQILGVHLWDNTTGILKMVLVEEVEQTTVNTLTIRVSGFPDNRFTGSIVIIGK